MTVDFEHLLGRSFLPGVRDCFELVRDFFKDNFGVQITSYARPIDWRADRDDLIRKLHEREGFEMITHWKPKDLRPADILAVTIGESNPNHLAIYVGDSTIIHHLVGRFSNSEPYRDFWQHSTCFLLRHPAVPDLRPTLPTADLRDLLRERYDSFHTAG